MSASGASPPSDEGAAGLLRRLATVVYTAVAMAGWRLDHLNAAWVVGGALSLALGQALIVANRPAWTFAYFLLTLVFYYGGLTWFVTSPHRARMIERHGEELAFRRFEVVLAMMFIHQGLGVGCVTALRGVPAFELPLDEGVAKVIGAAFFLTGFVVKVWSAVLIGVDVYYFRDIFVGRPLVAFVRRGPYRFLSNPMYGLGQVHGYGYAIWHRSLAGVAAMAACHALIYVFYFAAERPFLRRAYALGDADRA